MLHGLGRGCSLQQRHGIGEPDVLGRVHDQPARDEARILPGLDHPCEPEQRGIRVRPADRLDERRDHVVVGVALPVVDDRLPLHGVGGELQGLTLGLGRESSSLESRQRHPRVPAGDRHQMLERVVVDRQVVPAEPAFGVVQRAPDQRRHVVGGQRLQPHQQAPGEQRGIQREVRVLRRRADQRHGSLFDGRQQHVLLCLGPPMHLVHEQHGLEQTVAGAVHHLAGVGHAAVDRGELHQMGTHRIGQQVRERGLAGTGGPPQDQRRQRALLDQLRERPSGSDQVRLPDELRRRAGTHPGGEGDVGHGLSRTGRCSWDGSGRARAPDPVWGSRARGRSGGSTRRCAPRPPTP